MRQCHVGALLLVAILGLTACTTDDSSTVDSPDADASSPSAAPPSGSTTKPSRTTSYSYVLTSQCGFGGLFGKFAVVERDDVIESVERVGRANATAPRTRDIPTLKDLIEKAESAPPKAKVDLVVDRDGLPVFVKIDVPNSSDEEECYEIRDLEALDGAEATNDDVDLAGQWHLDEADIDGEQFTIPSDVHISFVDHWRATQAHVVCEVLFLGSPRVSGDEVEIVTIAGPGSMLSCPPMWKPSPLAAKTYFAALSAVDRGERTSDSLILTGPNVTLTYRRGG